MTDSAGLARSGSTASSFMVGHARNPLVTLGNADGKRQVPSLQARDDQTFQCSEIGPPSQPLRNQYSFCREPSRAQGHALHAGLGTALQIHQVVKRSTRRAPRHRRPATRNGFVLRHWRNGPQGESLGWRDNKRWPPEQCLVTPGCRDAVPAATGVLHRFAHAGVGGTSPRKFSLGD